MTATIPASEQPGIVRAPRTAGAFHGAGASWAAVAAWGAGLIELAVGAGALTQGGAARGAGIALVALGAGGLAWGAVTLARGRIVVPRTAVAGALAGTAAVVAALAADPVRTSVLAAASAAALLLTIAFACAARVRAASRGRTDAAPPRVWAILVAATLVAGVVTPALGATEAGRNAVPHGEHFVDPGHH
ncbi:hypothetical protein ACFUTX_13170 [Microbacterium sp. NPDC057407]|uniref:hypothetical protein n=1 Tax=Microbacterium sp. NPDC057407 TaxID=3346120 RepID=UPI0036721FAA